jgi:hypothetical protein
MTDQRLHFSPTWLQVILATLMICSTLFGGLWWLVGERTQYVLNEEFWASERIRPAMKLYIAEKTVSREEFSGFIGKWEVSTAKIQCQLDDINKKLDGKRQ